MHNDAVPTALTEEVTAKACTVPFPAISHAVLEGPSHSPTRTSKADGVEAAMAAEQPNVVLIMEGECTVASVE